MERMEMATTRKTRPRRAAQRLSVLAECAHSATKSWDKRRKDGWRFPICPIQSFAFFFLLYRYIWLKSYSFLNIAKQQMHSIAFLWFALICWCCSLPYPGGTAVGVSHSRGHDLESSALARRMWPISHQLDRQIPGRKPLNDAKCTSNSGGTSGSFDKLRTFHSLVGTLTAFAANFQMQSWCQEVLAGFQL